MRDEANRIHLEQELARLRGLPTPSDAGEAETLRRAIDVLENAQEVLAKTPDSHLLLLDTGSGDPVKVAVSVGDVDNADHVGVFTQGMDSRADTPTGLSGPVANMVALRNETDAQLYEAGTQNETPAMVVWMGYDSPQGAEVADPSYGIQGGSDLASFGEASAAPTSTATSPRSATPTLVHDGRRAAADRPPSTTSWPSARRASARATSTI